MVTNSLGMLALGLFLLAGRHRFARVYRDEASRRVYTTMLFWVGLGFVVVGSGGAIAGLIT